MTQRDARSADTSSSANWRPIGRISTITSRFEQTFGTFKHKWHSSGAWMKKPELPMPVLHQKSLDDELEKNNHSMNTWNKEVTQQLQPSNIEISCLQAEASNLRDSVGSNESTENRNAENLRSLRGQIIPWVVQAFGSRPRLNDWIWNNAYSIWMKWRESFVVQLELSSRRSASNRCRIWEKVPSVISAGRKHCAQPSQQHPYYYKVNQPQEPHSVVSAGRDLVPTNLQHSGPLSLMFSPHTFPKVPSVSSPSIAFGSSEMKNPNELSSIIRELEDELRE